MSLGKGAVDLLERALRLVLSRGRRAALGGHIADRANGDGDACHDTNGERWLVEQFRNRCGAAPVTVFDVGANTGHWTRMACGVFGAAATVYAFEPVPATYRKLQASLATWGLPAKVVPVNAAVSAEVGEAQIYTSDSSDEFSSLHKRHTDGEGVRFEKADAVRLISGDAFCRDNGIEKIDLLKVDTEGHELAVFKGLAQMLSERKVELLQFEYGSTWLDSRTQLLDAFELLGSYGYSLAKLMPDRLWRMPQYHQSLERFRLANYVAYLPHLENAFRATS